jgi:hypothetical protein
MSFYLTKEIKESLASLLPCIITREFSEIFLNILTLGTYFQELDNKVDYFYEHRGIRESLLIGMLPELRNKSKANQSLSEKDLIISINVFLLIKNCYF